MNERFDGHSNGHISRRDFIKGVTVLMGGFIGAVVGIPAINYLISPALRKVGKKRDWLWRVYCCRVSWHPNIQNYVSPCHDGHFDIMGKNISGPPPRPLDEFITKIEDGNLFIQLPPFRRPA